MVGVTEERISYAVVLGQGTAADCRTVIKIVNDELGGRGGGKSDLAQGGAAYSADYEERLNRVKAKLSEWGDK